MPYSSQTSARGQAEGTYLGNLDENIIDDNWNVDKKTFSNIWSTYPRFRVLQRRPRKCHTWVDG